MGKTQITVPASQITKNWQAGMKANVQKIKDGVNRVTESPMEKAALAVDKQVEGVRRAAESGRTANALRNVDLQTWKAVTAQKVGERLSGGVEAAGPKMDAFNSYLVTTLNTVLPTVNAMPDTTFEERMAKMVAMATAMHENPYKG